MKSAAPVLLPLLRTRSQGDVTAWIMLHPEESFSLTEIANHIGVSPATVMREVDRLSDAGLVAETRRGNTRIVRAATDNVVYGPLSDLMAVTFGPRPILTELLQELPGVDEAHIYGSWASRYADHPGAVPADIDVLVIGSTDLDVLDEVADEASRRLGRPVHIRRVRPEAWSRADDDPFRTTVLSRPMVTLVPGPES